MLFSYIIIVRLECTRSYLQIYFRINACRSLYYYIVRHVPFLDLFSKLLLCTNNLYNILEYVFLFSNRKPLNAETRPFIFEHAFIMYPYKAASKRGECARIYNVYRTRDV